MKSLSNYIEQAQTELFAKYGVIFAFSMKQFEEQREEDTTYSHLNMGTFCPKENVTAYLEGHKRIVLEGIKTDKKENGDRSIILRELINYECFYTGEIDDCVDALEDYGFSSALIVEVYENNREKYSD